MPASSARFGFLRKKHAAVLTAVQRWANDDLRSLNAQIEFLLRRALQEAGRLPAQDGERGGDGGQV